MSATLQIINNFSIEVQGLTFTGKQGAYADQATDTMDVTVTGLVHPAVGLLGTGAVVTVYDDDTDGVLTDFAYLFYWSDVVTYIQLIGSTCHAIHKVAAKVPFVLAGYDLILSAVNTTKITGAAEPVLEDIDSVVLGNYSGNDSNYVFGLIL